MTLIEDLRWREQSTREEIDRLNTRLEENDRERMKLLRQREQAALEAVECHTAANLLDHAGLKAELREGVPFVQVDHQCHHETEVAPV